MVQMSGLGSRHAEDIYTSGHNDGVPGIHPGHTPYMNVDDWGGNWWGGSPSWMRSRGYPAWSQWPHGEGLWPVRFNYSNSEFTPRQTMRGKHVLLSYLFSLSGVAGNTVTPGKRTGKRTGFRKSTHAVQRKITISKSYAVNAPDNSKTGKLCTVNGRIVSDGIVKNGRIVFNNIPQGIYLLQFK
jgi:hypothetical protein